MRSLQTEVNEKTLVVREISRIAKEKDQQIEMLGSQLVGKQFFTYINPSQVLFFY